MRKNPRNAIESDPVFGSIMLITFAILMPFPIAVLARLFGPLDAYVWFLGCLAFWAFEIYVAFSPFEPARYENDSPAARRRPPAHNLPQKQIVVDSSTWTGRTP